MEWGQRKKTLNIWCEDGSGPLCPPLLVADPISLPVGHSRLATRRLQSLDGDVISTIQGTQGSGVPHLHQSTHLWNCVCLGTPYPPPKRALTADMGRALRLQADLHHIQGCHWGRSGDMGKMSMQDRVSPKTRHAQSALAAPVPARLLLNKEVTTAPAPEATIC